MRIEYNAIRFIMIRIAVFFIIILTTFPVFAIKLNQRGEKMVSEIRVAYSDSAARSPYTIKFGYDADSEEINTVVYERRGVNHIIVRLKRSNDGIIEGENCSDGEICDRFTFKIGVDKEPVEMIWYEKNIYGKFVKAYTFKYEYDFNDYDLSILSIANGDDCAAKRDLVKIDEGDAYTYSNIVNLETNRESKPTKSDRCLSYGGRNDDLNIDLYQILWGYCSVGISTLDLLGSNFIFLTKWVTVHSSHLPKTAYRYDIEYKELCGNIIKAKVKYRNSSDVFYTITLKYVE